MSSKPKNRQSSRPLQAPNGESVSFGTWLRRQREAREISLREIADASKISLRYLEAFEQDRFELLPARVFVQGFLREYGRYVGLDPDEVVNHYLATQDALEPEDEPKASKAPELRSRSSWLWHVALVLGVAATLAIAAMLAFESERNRSPASPEESEAPSALASPTAPVELPTPELDQGVEQIAEAEPPPPPADVTSPLRVAVSFTEKCWVEMVVDGRRSQQEHAAGELLELAAEQAVVLTLGNAGGVRIEVNGRPFPLNKGPGEVARDIRIDRQTVQELTEGP